MFAARCLVEIVIEIYKQGQGWEDIQLELKLAGTRLCAQQDSSRTKPESSQRPPVKVESCSGMQEQKQIEQLPPEAQKKARLLVDLEKDVLLQWMALIFLTLKELDVKQVPPSHPATQPQQSQGKHETLHRRQGALANATGCMYPPAQSGPSPSFDDAPAHRGLQTSAHWTGRARWRGACGCL